VILVASAYVLVAALSLAWLLPLRALLVLVTLPLAVPLVRVVRAGGDPRRLNAVLRGTARLSLLFSALLALALALPGVL
jgi:1,4-dihydroxy-2-naphthoate octaprenyltransferase